MGILISIYQTESQLNQSMYSYKILSHQQNIFYQIFVFVNFVIF